MGSGPIVAESTSPVGNGTAGLLFINGMPPPGLVAGSIAVLGAGLGDVESRGRKGHGYDGEDDTPPPELNGGDAIGAEFSGWKMDTFIASFCPCSHGFVVPLLNEKKKYPSLDGCHV